MGVDQPISAALVAGGEVRGASEVEQVKAHLMVALGEARGGRRGLVGVGAEHDGGGDRRRGCSGKGTATRSGGLAS